MKSAFFLALTFMAVSVYGATWKITGDDGWKARIGFENPSRVSVPVFVQVFNKSGFTNSEALMDIQAEQDVRLDFPDGEYGYRLTDRDKKTLLEGRFLLKTPFKVIVRKILQDSAELEIIPNGRKQLKIALSMTNKTVFHSEMSISSPTNYRVQGLSSSSLYELVIGSDKYYKKTEFLTLPKNVAENKPVFGTFNRLPESRFVDDSTPVITRINDGKWEWYRGMAFSGEVNAQEQFVYINLEHLARISVLQVVWHAFYYPEAYYIVFGRDGRNWEILERNRSAFTNRIAPDNTPVKVDRIETNIQAQYIGIIIRKGQKLYSKNPERNYSGLLEFEAYE